MQEVKQGVKPACKECSSHIGTASWPLPGPVTAFELVLNETYSSRTSLFTLKIPVDLGGFPEPPTERPKLTYMLYPTHWAFFDQFREG